MSGLTTPETPAAPPPPGGATGGPAKPDPRRPLNDGGSGRDVAASGRPHGPTTADTPSIAPVLSYPPERLLQAQGMRVAFFDVDGVLTDGRIYLSERGEEFKAFSTLDGHGLKLLALGGIVPAVVTGRDSPAVRRRVADLGIAHAAYGVDDKLAAAEALLQRLGLDWTQAAAIGDDWPDLPLLRRAAFTAAPANAHVEVKAVVHLVTEATGGHGAAREFCDLLLVAAGRYASLLAGRQSTLQGG